MNHPLQCQCGTIKGAVGEPRNANRVVCYCKDCQAFAYFLGRETDVLDERGGSDVIQVSPRNVTFTEGIAALACMRLTEKGLLRWYASCCHTPIGNTMASPGLSFVGLVHSCLQGGEKRLDDAFGPVRAWIYTDRATGNPKPKQAGLPSTIFWFLGTTLKDRVSGGYKRTPFFRADTGAPVVTPRVLSSGEHVTVMNAVRAAGG
jgi:hypothetical protein